MVRHFLDTADLDSATLRTLIEAARALKRDRRTPDMKRPLAGRTLALIFDKPSTRTRVSFDVGMRELGGETIMLTASDMQIGRGGTPADTPRGPPRPPPRPPPPRPAPTASSPTPGCRWATASATAATTSCGPTRSTAG